MLVDDIKKRMFEAMKAGRTVEKEILRVCLGEITTEQARTHAGTLSDEEVQAVLRKLLKSNRESLSQAEDPKMRAELEEEQAVLESFLPRALGVDEIVEALAPVADSIRAAKATGPAMGLAMKHLKAAGATVEARDVTAAVERIRS